MTIFYSKEAVKTIGSMDKPTKERIRKAIEALPSGDVKPLSGHHQLYRLRVGGWRIVFSYLDGESIAVERVAPRGGVYKGGKL